MPHQPPTNADAQSAGTPPTAAPPPGGPGRSPAPGKALLVLAVVAPLVLCGLVGVLSGGIVATSTTDPVGPSALPSTDADFPSVDRRYLPGVKVATVVEDWLKKTNSYTCTPPERPSRTLSEAPQRQGCTAPGNLRWKLSVDVEFDDETHVRHVRGDCVFKPGAKVCASLFATMADAVLSGNPELRKQAYEWAEKNAEADNVTTIGGVRFTIKLEPRSITAEPAL
ncbi:hypothetical protein [Micromonospora rubida]|uniref:hypothetical protein n=1 Tax=Micromonospora rubida TaxID=2697657 RepID=UPI0013789276|nr:hypothetical protein [Micromonospora rubida]NBE79570.1 hypothetical protein [Micromonospora rubida]